MGWIDDEACCDVDCGHTFFLKVLIRYRLRKLVLEKAMQIIL